MTQTFPSYESIRQLASNYKGVDAKAVEVFIATMRLAHNCTSRADAYFTRFGISLSRYKVMMILLSRGGDGASPAEIAQHISVRRATITGVIDTLENDGWVERSPDPNDRRALIVRITELGKSKLNEFVPQHYKNMTESLANITPEEREFLLTIFKKLTISIESMYGPDVDEK
jgi:DNA-binding MarR family transcriptional regulator